MEHLERKSFKHLAPEQVDHFMKVGWLRLEGCFTAETANDFTKHVWTRLGFDPKDPSTWTRDRTNMPQHHLIPVKDIAPKAWDAICEIVGGEDRVTEKSKTWADSFIVNLGSPETEGSAVSPKDLDNWHVDGDFFVHFLDSPEQGLLVIPCWSDVHENGGATWVCDQGPKKIGQWLHDHPEGVTPWMTPIPYTSPPPGPLDFPDPPRSERLTHYISLIKQCPDSSFHEMTGKVGDVILLHPLTLHSASKNGRRIPRIITNPPVSLLQPFNFSRSNPEDYSLVELKTIQDLGGEEKLKGWGIKGPRLPITPDRLKLQKGWLEEENKRLEALGLEKAKRPELEDDYQAHRAGTQQQQFKLVDAV